MNRITVKEDDQSVILGLVIGILFTVLLVIRFFASQSTREMTKDLVWICVILALAGYLFAYSSLKRKVEFTTDEIIFTPLFGKQKVWKYSDLSQIRVLKKAFLVYDISGKRVLMFEAQLMEHSDVIKLLKSRDLM